MGKLGDFKEFAKYTSLNVMGMTGLSCYILADTYFVSKSLGAIGLTALNLAIPVYSFIHGSGLMFGMGGATKFSIFKAQKASNSADKVFTNTVFVCIAVSLLFLLTGIFYSGQLTSCLGADAGAAGMTNRYLKVILLFSPVFMMNDVLLCFVRNDGNPRLSMFAMLAGSLSNIVLDFVFLFPFRMGITGAALATGLAPVISMAILSGHWLAKNNSFRFLRSKPQPDIVWNSIALGFPSFVTEVSSGIVMIVFNTIIMRLNGNIGVAAYGVIANLSLVVIAMDTGIAQGIQPIISRSFGEKERKKTERILYYGLTTMFVLAVLVYAGFYLWAEPLTDVFNSEGNRQLHATAVKGLKLYFTAAPFAGFNIVFSSYLTSTEKPVPAHLLSLMRGFILIIPMAFLLPHFMGIKGVWTAYPITEGIVCFIGILFYLRLRFRK